MPTLLHLDSALYPEGSASRDVTAAFREEWEIQHPDGTVIYRDLAAEPLPHLDLRGAIAGFSGPASHTPEQAAAYTRRPLRLTRQRLLRKVDEDACPGSEHSPRSAMSRVRP